MIMAYYSITIRLTPIIEFDRESNNMHAYINSRFDRLEQLILGQGIKYIYEYDQMKTNRIDLHRDLFEYLYHPIRVQKYLDTGMDIDEYLQ